jgi:hypothetical protein
MLYKGMVAGQIPAVPDFVNAITAVKDKYPKPV